MDFLIFNSMLIFQLSSFVIWSNSNTFWLNRSWSLFSIQPKMPNKNWYSRVFSNDKSMAQYLSSSWRHFTVSYTAVQSKNAARTSTEHSPQCTWSIALLSESTLLSTTWSAGCPWSLWRLAQSFQWLHCTVPVGLQSAPPLAGTCWSCCRIRHQQTVVHATSHNLRWWVVGHVEVGCLLPVVLGSVQINDFRLIDLGYFLMMLCCVSEVGRFLVHLNGTLQCLYGSCARKSVSCKRRHPRASSHTSGIHAL